MSTYDSGWLAATANADTTFTHGLGTNAIHTQIFHSASSDGSNASVAGDILDSSGNRYGARVHGITSSELVVETGYSATTTQWGSGTEWGGGYIRIIASSILGDSGGSSGGSGSYSTGWVSLGANADSSAMNFTHNLGTTDVSYTIYVSANSNGSGAIVLPGNAQTTTNKGAQIQSVTDNSFTVQLGTQGYHSLDSSGNQEVNSFDNKYMKVVVTGGVGGSSGCGDSGVSNVFAQGFIDLNGNVTKSINIASATHTSTYSDAYRTFEVNLINGPSSDHDSYNVQIAVRATSENNDTAAITTYRWTSPTQILVRVNGYNNPANVDGISILVLDDVSVGGSSGGGGGGGGYGDSVIDAMTESFFYSDEAYQSPTTITNSTDGARFYNKDEYILVNLVYAAGGNQSNSLSIDYYPPGSSTGYNVGSTPVSYTHLTLPTICSV